MKALPTWLRIYTIVMMLFLIAPIAIVLLTSLTPSSYVTFPPTGVSLRWFEKVLSNSEFMVPLWNSIKLAFSATVISLALSVPAAITLVRRPNRWNALVEALILSPLAVPTIILATGLLFFSARVGLSESWIGLVAGHVLVTLPYCFRTVYGVYRQTNREVEEAARVLGASQFQTFRHVTMPIISPGLTAGAIFACLVSFDEVAIALLMSTPSTTTLPVSIMSFLVYNYDPSVAAISALQIAIVVGLLLILEWSFGLNRLLFSDIKK
ncbi:hypothetical protein AWN88_00355 [Agrobacterium tumefaciens]|nr:hypothetical protein AWN88_00355 [Agrobacterium tumefaciens]KAJ32572.1 ABC transporter permease [Agrobacterium tumefaciens]